MNKTIEQRIEEKLLGLEISIETEKFVISGLAEYRDIFNKKVKEATPFDNNLRRRMTQLLDSEVLIKNWKQEYEDLVNLYNFWKSGIKDNFHTT